MKAQFTPGPWHVQPIGSRRYVEATGPKFICDMQRDECQNEQEIAEADANARLIASAPELLEACKLAEMVLSGRAYRSAVDPYATIVAAIAKAEGKI